jgi:tryptophanase
MAEHADERYARSDSYYRFRDAVSATAPYPYVFPVVQGRAAEDILFSELLRPGQISLSNTHFDTTTGNVMDMGCEARQLPCEEAADLDSTFPFKGNIDLPRLERTLTGPEASRVGLVLMTITNNGGGGQPVSMANMQATADLCRKHGVPLFLDGARFAENAWLVTQREPGFSRFSPQEVARRAFELADGCVVSLKKDGLGHEGGFIGLRDERLAKQCEVRIMLKLGFPTYGGLSGATQEEVAQGLREVVDPDYLRSRATDATYLATAVQKAGVDIVSPPGMHAIYLNAGRLLPHLAPEQFPGHALACQLYLDGGIRCCELGSLYLGELDADLNLVRPAPYELVRLALPRRVYDQSHYEYVAEILASIAQDPSRVPGYRIVEAEEPLRPMNARLTPQSHFN